jgi:hypothetical protein
MTVFTNNFMTEHIWNLVHQSHQLASNEAIDVNIIVVPEYGNKVRLVSKTQLCHSQATSLVNKFLLDIIGQLPICSDFLKGNREDAIRRAFRYAVYEPRIDQVDRFGQSVFVSTDLTAASDLLPHDLLQHIVEGIILEIAEEFPLFLSDEHSQDLFNTLRDITKGIKMTYPDGSTILSSRGVLMGIGGTWPLMSIAHILFIVIASKRINYSTQHAIAAAAIGGDDLIAFWPMNMYLSYKTTIEDFGGKFSVGKTFVSPKYGNFAEVQFMRRSAMTPLTYHEAVQSRELNNSLYKSHLHFFSEIPIRSLVAQDLDDLSWSVSMATTPESMTRVRHVIRAIRPGIYKDALKAGICATLPRCLGGIGLPPRKGSVSKFSAPVHLRMALGKYLYGTADKNLFPHGPPSWSECVDKISLRARSQSIDQLTFENECQLTVLSIRPNGKEPRQIIFDGIPTGTILMPEADSFEMRLSDWMGREVAVMVRKLVFCNRYPGAFCKSKTVRPFMFAKGVSEWINFQLRGGVPKDMAIRNNGNRWALLARMTDLNRSCFVEVRMNPGTYLGKVDHDNVVGLTQRF